MIIAQHKVGDYNLVCKYDGRSIYLDKVFDKTVEHIDCENFLLDEDEDQEDEIHLTGLEMFLEYLTGLSDEEKKSLPMDPKKALSNLLEAKRQREAAHENYLYAKNSTTELIDKTLDVFQNG